MAVRDTFYTVISNLRYRLIALGGTTDPAGNAAGNVVIGGINYTEGVLATYDAEIYNVAGDVTTDGSLITGLSDYTKWAFHVTGIDATGATLGIKVGLVGDAAEGDFLALRDASSAGQVTTIVADGVYFCTSTYTTHLWKDMIVDRIAAGTGVGTIVVRALGRV